MSDATMERRPMSDEQPAPPPSDAIATALDSLEHERTKFAGQIAAVDAEIEQLEASRRDVESDMQRIDAALAVLRNETPVPAPTRRRRRPQRSDDDAQARTYREVAQGATVNDPHKYMSAERLDMVRAYFRDRKRVRQADAASDLGLAGAAAWAAFKLLRDSGELVDGERERNSKVLIWKGPAA